MQIDFDNLRKQTCNTYDALAKELNNLILMNEPLLYVDVTIKLMAQLKAQIATIACCSDKTAGFADVLGNRKLITFKPEK